MKKIKLLRTASLAITVTLVSFFGNVETKASTTDEFIYQSAYGWWNETGYDTNKITNRVVSGDFNGDGKDDIAAFYDYGNSETRIHVFLSDGSKFVYPSGYGWWSETGYNANKINGRVVSGDFNGDGKDDIGAFYDYGDGETRLHIFISDGSKFIYQSGYGWWNTTGYDANKITGRVVSGDFNGDGKDDIGAFYDYGNGETRLHTFLSNGSKFIYPSGYGWWKDTGYNANKITGKVVSGDFNGSGGEDVAAFYDYENSQTRIHVFLANTNTNSGESASRQALLNVAKSQIGYAAGSYKYTKYGEWYGLPYDEWCAMFVSWCSNQAGIGTNIIPNHASCLAGVNWFKNNGIWKSRASGYIPKQGDLIYYDYGNNGTIDHVGIVESVSNGTITSIEGNVGGGNGIVARQYHSLNNGDILGYGIPNM